MAHREIEEVYLHAYQDGKEAKISLGNYFRFYNAERSHQAIGYKTPAEVYLNLSYIVESRAFRPLYTAGLSLNSTTLLS